jgi:hypothetical protein
MNSQIIDKEYYYTWRGRHRGVYFMALWFLAFIVLMEVIAIFRGVSIKLDHEVFVYLLIAALCFGLIGDHFSASGVLKRYHMVGIGKEVLAIQVEEKERIFLPWRSITKIDDFNIFDILATGHTSKSPDFWAARGVGGLRITTSDNEIYKIYRTLRHYKEVRFEIIQRSYQAVLLKNGKLIPR